MGFFHPLIIPSISIFFLIALAIFYLVEKKSVMCWESHRKGLNLNRVKVIYTSSFFGFLLIQVISFDNIKLVLDYLNDFGEETVSRILESFIDYTTLLIVTTIAFIFTSKFSYKKLIPRILDQLIESEELQ